MTFLKSMRTSRCGAARAAVFDSVVLAMRLLCGLAMIYVEDTSALQYAARSACLLVRLPARVPPAGLCNCQGSSGLHCSLQPSVVAHVQ